MDIENLKLFLHLAETLHFGKTSAACHMSPSTLSRQIQRLESDVGQLLFERDNRTVSLTSHGVRFRQYARETLERWHIFHQSLNAGSAELTGEISMYCSVTASYSVLPALLSDFRGQHPKIEIKLRTGDAASSIEKIMQDEVDIVIAAKPDKLPAHLDFFTTTISPLRFIMPRETNEITAMLDENPVPWERIPMIVPERGVARKRIDQWFRQKGVKPDIYGQVLGNEGIVSMVSLGFGVGLVPDLVIKNSPVEDRIRILMVDNPLEPYHVGVCARKKKIRIPLVSAFWEVALKHRISMNLDSGPDGSYPAESVVPDPSFDA